MHMVNYSINTFFTKEECDTIIEFALKNGTQFNYDESDGGWDCKRIYDTSFKNNIITSVAEKIPSISMSDINIDKSVISMTRYYEGRYLELHRDRDSNKTIVIALSSDYFDGRFVLSDKLSDITISEDTTKLNLKLGEGVVFDGKTTYHGVMPVTNGLRCALNIWMSIKNTKKLI
jgi:hypothetical protein